MLIGTLYSHLSDAYMGLANPNSSPSTTTDVSTNWPQTPATPRTSSPPFNRSSTANIAKAELYIERTRDCFKKAGYLDGECEQLMKKAIIAKLRGDEKVAEELAMMHNSVWEEGLAALEDYENTQKYRTSIRRVTSQVADTKENVLLVYSQPVLSSYYVHIQPGNCSRCMDLA